MEPCRLHSSPVMFSKIVVPLSDLPESQRVLRAAIDPAHTCNVELATVSILDDRPAYTSFAIVVDPGSQSAMKETRCQTQGEFHVRSLLAQEHGVRATGAVVEGQEIKAILPISRGRCRSACHRSSSARLLFIPPPLESLYDLAQDAHYGVLGVH